MWSRIARWFHRPEEEKILIENRTMPTLPRGAKRILIHRPAVSLRIESYTIGPSSIRLEQFVPGDSYDAFLARHRDLALGDAVILDAIIERITRDPRRVDEMITKIFGNFSGQIFFLGTYFEGEKGQRLVLFLNIRTYMPHLRYLCPAHHPNNHSVVCCACFLSEDTIRQLQIAA